jgi:ABC-type transporter Mla subunit MlaD
VKVPLGSVFIIQSSGLMGDAYISISAPSGSAAGSGYIQPGQTIKGARMASLNDVTAGGLDLVESLKQRLEDMRITVAKVNDGILGEENVTNLKAAIINLKEASESFKSASKRVDDFMTKSDETVVAAKEAIATLKGALGRVDGLAVKAEGAMAKVDDAAGELKATIVGVKEFAEAGEKTATASTELLKKMQSGSGTLPMLLNDSETRDNIESLLRNLKRFGVLFYRDRPAEPAEKPEKAAPPTKERRTR